MSVTLTPPRRKPTEAEIEAVINKGGKTSLDEMNVADPKHKVDVIKHFNIRLTSDILDRIDSLRASRPRKPGSPKLGVSTHDWIVEAVLEKLDRDGKF